jgi:hypothetical protein
MQSPTGDYMFGRGQANFYIDSAYAVAQSAMTRLRLFVGEYFPDLAQGMDWQSDVLGFQTAAVYDAAVQKCISGTQGFAAFVDYSSVLDVKRVLHINARITTIFTGLAVPIVVAVPVSGYGVGGYNTRPYGG